jgi:soluble lytic murein transglycosylase
VLGGGYLAFQGVIGDAFREVTLPLRHEDIIRQQAREKGLDPALLAAVIRAESGFRPRPSKAGAEGLMQITPETAHFIADRSGGTQFELKDLDSPQINIQYGSWYLRHLIQQFGGDEDLAIAAYNAGPGSVSDWVAANGGIAAFDVETDIPFPETRHYVENVRTWRAEYRAHYADELGL